MWNTPGLQTLAVVTIILALPVALAAATDPVRLEFKPTAAPILYEQRTADVTRITTAGGAFQHTGRSTRQVLQETAAAGDHLLVTLSLRAVDISAGGQRLPVIPPRLMATARFAVSSTGECLDRTQSLGLVLPSTPAGPGTEWRSLVGPVGSLQRIHTRYRVSRVEEVAGRRCLVIEAASEGRGEPRSHRPSIRHRGRARIHFDPVLGQIVSSRSRTRTEIEYPPSNRLGYVRSTSDVASRLELLGDQTIHATPGSGPQGAQASMRRGAGSRGR